MARHRYQTYVFDTAPDLDPVFEPKHRDMLGPVYKDAPPCAWMDGHALQAKSKFEDFIVELAANSHEYSIYEIAERANKLLAER